MYLFKRYYAKYGCCCYVQPNHHQTNFIVFVTQMKSQSSIWFNFEEKKNEKKKRASNKGLLKKGQI